MFDPLMLLLHATVAVSETVTRFTNIQCKVLDPSYCSYKKCELKLLGRGIVAINVHAILLTGSFNNAKVKFHKSNYTDYYHSYLTFQINLSMWRKYNGYRPFMFNRTFDF